MNTWQIVYEQLQEILNKCIELWWNKELFSEWCYVLEDWVYNNKWWRIPIYSFHDIFSKDSGLIEFIEWKVRDGISNKRRRNTIILLQYRSMSSLTAEEKIEYFVKNARVPTR